MSWYGLTKIAGWLDSEANRLSRQIFDRIKQIKLPEDKLFAIYDPIHGVDSINVIITHSDPVPKVRDLYDMRAYTLHYGEGRHKTIDIYIYFRDNFTISQDPTLFENFIFRLKNLIRHELTHVLQDAGMLEKSHFKGIENLKKIKDYLLTPAEIEAFVEGIYFEAKKKAYSFLHFFRKLVFRTYKTQIIVNGFK